MQQNIVTIFKTPSLHLVQKPLTSLQLKLELEWLDRTINLTLASVNLHPVAGQLFLTDM